jgi:hypothetical protein
MKISKPLHRFISLLASLHLTTIALILLMVLVITGTLYQVDHGIYAAQERFFKAWFIFFGGVIPFPAVRTVIAVLVVNLIAAAIRKRPFTIRTAGIIILHIGTVMLVGGSVIASRFTQESAITLSQGQSTETTYDFNKWNFNISVNESKNGTHYVKHHTFPLKKLRSNRNLPLPPSPFTVHIKKIYTNCMPILNSDSSAIIGFTERPPTQEQGRNLSGIVFTISTRDINNPATRYIYAGNMAPMSFTHGSDTISLVMQPRTIDLPMRVTLSRFDVEWHPGTTKPKSFKTRLRLLGKHLDREVTIEMNRPFRYESFTFYQMGYSGEKGNYSSTLAIVKNPLRYMPYVASLIIVIGLFLHFFVKMWFELVKIRGANRE